MWQKCFKEKKIKEKKFNKEKLKKKKNKSFCVCALYAKNVISFFGYRKKAK